MDTETTSAAFVSAEELARRTGFSAWHLRKAARLGQIPAMKLGETWRFNPDEVVAVLRRKAARAVSSPASSSTEPARRSRTRSSAS